MFIRLYNVFSANKISIAKGHNEQPKTAIDWSKRYRTLLKQKAADWSESEDKKLQELVAEKGKNWRLFVKYFQGRSKDQLRKHYSKLQKKSLNPFGGIFYQDFKYF